MQHAQQIRLATRRGVNRPDDEPSRFRAREEISEAAGLHRARAQGPRGPDFDGNDGLGSFG